MSILYVYLLILNLIGFLLMGLDKYRARKKRWRIPEARFFLIAAIGGSLGIWMGMSVFRHKTQHRTFLYGVPVLLVLNVVAIVVIFRTWPDIWTSP